MSDQRTPEQEADAARAKAEQDEAAAKAADTGDEGEGGEDQLGEKGQRALEAEKQKRRDATAARRTAETALADARAEIERLKSGASDDAAEQARRQQQEQATKDAETKANNRILRSEIKRLGTGKVIDPAILLTLLDTSQFEVNSDGDADEGEILDAIAELVKNKPYLAAAGAAKVTAADIDAGVRGGLGKGKPVQVTEQQLKTMTPDEIVKAQDEGRLADLLGGG